MTNPSVPSDPPERLTPEEERLVEWAYEGIDAALDNANIEPPPMTVREILRDLVLRLRAGEGGRGR